MCMRRYGIEIINSSTKNGTIHEAKKLATIKNRLYLCSAFETQMPQIEY